MTKTKRIIGMVLGILFIGLCVSFLRLSQFGVDPFSAMNLGISGFIGWSFGTWQLLVNAIIHPLVLIQHTRLQWMDLPVCQMLLSAKMLLRHIAE